MGTALMARWEVVGVEGRGSGGGGLNDGSQEQQTFCNCFQWSLN